MSVICVTIGTGYVGIAVRLAGQVRAGYVGIAPELKSGTDYRWVAKYPNPAGGLGVGSLD